MKKKIFLFIIFVIVVFTLTGCDKQISNEKEMEEARVIEDVVEKNKTSEEIVSELKEKGLNIGKIVTYNEENDLNSLLGRPHQYTSKTTFEVIGIEQSNSNLDPEYFSEEERNEPIGGTIEVFKSEEDMKNRKNYVETVSASASIFTEYSYGSKCVLLRLNKQLTPTEAKKFEEAFYEIVK